MHADTDTLRPQTPLNPLLQSRWSPRAFHQDLEIPAAEIDSMLEAARWAPSANNIQPWRFVVARHGSAAFDALVKTFAAGNVPWAQHASALVVAGAMSVDGQGQAQPWAVYDLGQAVAHLTLQAHSLGYHAHQIGGFDREAVRAVFDLPDALLPVTVIALGAVADPDVLPDGYRERETKPRTRLPLREIVLRKY